MKKLFLSTLLVGSLFAGASHAGYDGGQFGQHRWPHWYVGLTGSMNFVSDSDVTLGNRGVGTVAFQDGYGLAGSIGYTPGPSGTLLDYTRFEFEIGHRMNDLENFAAGGRYDRISGEVKSYSYMANVFFDFDTQTRVSPYVGGGLGLSTMTLESSTLSIEDEDNVFAYQAMVGLGWQPESLLNTVLQVGYRYHATTSPSFADTAGRNFEHDYNTHNIEAGARFRF
ncbi:MAG: porin family protein [Alphaproteobacteria bacterium]|nr:MAG: porin family protein [Alphaproteobacteria bacterium]TAF76072.1 MAG: porin family protein [Alphaproteobacteria bacterium]